MKLAKYLLTTGDVGVARVEGDQLVPLDLSAGQYRTLAEVLEDLADVRQDQIVSRNRDGIRCRAR